jgi:thiol-disulfide isomerase/thioredoxin
MEKKERSVIMSRSPSFERSDPLDLKTLLSAIEDRHGQTVSPQHILDGHKYVVIFVGAPWCGHCQEVSDRMMNHVDLVEDEPSEDEDEDQEGDQENATQGTYALVFVNASPEDEEEHRAYIKNKPFYTMKPSFVKTYAPVIDGYYGIQGYPTFKIHRVEDGSPIPKIASRDIHHRFSSGASLKELLRYV